MEREATIEVDPVEITRLIKQLGHKKVDRRLEAEDRLNRIGSAALPKLLIALRREARLHRFGLAFNVVVGVTLALFAWQHYAHKGFDGESLFYGSLGFLNIAMFCLAASMKEAPPSSAFAATERHRALVRIISASVDARTICPLADAYLQIREHEVRRVTRDSLLQLLPRVKASDRGRFTDRDREQICRLTGGHNDALILAALRALDQIADAKALAYLDRIRSKNPEVIKAAEACRELLLTRADLDQRSRTLLRPTEVSPEYAPLLQPAESTPAVAAEQLLRPSEPRECESP